MTGTNRLSASQRLRLEVHNFEGQTECTHMLLIYNSFWVRYNYIYRCCCFGVYIQGIISILSVQIEKLAISRMF